jgi:hypothetical protein
MGVLSKFVSANGSISRVMSIGVLVALALPAISIGLSQAQEQCPFPNYDEPNRPEMKPCINSSSKLLPPAWEAVTLMAPYLYRVPWPRGADLQVGHFIYDSTAVPPLMRVTRYGVQQDTVVDMLISPDATWYLDGDYDDPVCYRSATIYRVPSRIWQSDKLQAQCVGSHPTAPRMNPEFNVDWWKQKSPSQSPGAKGQAGDWFWFDANGYPTRTFFWENNPELPAILGDYAYTNFYSFEPMSDTKLQSIYASCLRTSSAEMPEEDLLELLAHSSKPRTNHPASVSDLIPGLSANCTGTEPPYWPKHMYATTFMTAAKYDTPKPLWTSVNYNSGADGGPPRIRTRLHKEDNDGRPYFSDALLVGNSSFGIDTWDQSGYPQKDCGAGPYTSLPGSPHPDWGRRNPCSCMGTIDDNSVLSPGRKTQLIACPLPSQLPSFPGLTIFWMWYTVESPPQPVVFLQTKADITLGTGLCIADYFSWSSPTEQCGNLFQEPSTCTQVLPPGPPPLPACLRCHIPSTNAPKEHLKW